MPSFGYVTVASALHDADAVGHLTAGVRSVLDPLGGRPLDGPEAALDRPMVVLVATGGTEAAVLDVVDRRHALVPYEPVVLVAHPLHNSLPAALEAMARLRRDGRRGRIEQVDGSRSGSLAARLAATVADVAAVHRLHHMRLGVVGTPSDWLVASVPDRHRMHSRWGVELVDVDIGRVVAGHGDATREQTDAVAVRFLGRMGTTISPELASAAALHPALTAVIDDERLDAVAVRCFDFVTGLATSGCVALAELNDTGVVAGCEGDIASTVGMLLVHALFDQPAWIANPAWIDADTDHVVLAHCTVAPSMVDDIEVHTHFESGLGIGLRGMFRPGPVTLLRLGGVALEQCWVADAEIESAGSSPDLCRTQTTVRVLDAPVAELLDAPLGNHLLLFHGHHRARIQRWWQLAMADV